MGPPTSALVLAALIVASNGLPRLEKDGAAGFIGDATSEIATAVLQSYIDEKNNIAFSPMGYSALMAILAEGARGNTRAQLVDALHLPAEEQVTRKAYKNVLDNLKEANKLNVPEFHTWFYVYKNFSIEPEFKRIIKENYLTEVKNVEPLYEDTMIDPPNPELDAMMHLDHDDKNDKAKPDKEEIPPEKQGSVSEEEHKMHEKGEIKTEKPNTAPQKEEMNSENKNMMPAKLEEMPEKDSSDKQEKMPAKQDISPDKDNNAPNKEVEFEVTPEMIENKPDSIRDPFLEDLLNKELEEKDKKEKAKEEMKKEETVQQSNMKAENASASNKEESMMMQSDDKKDMDKKGSMRLRRSVKHSAKDATANKKPDESMTEEKKDSMTEDEDSFKEGTLMEESLMTHAMEEGAAIEEAIKKENQSLSKEKETGGNPKKEMSESEMQPMAEKDKKKPVEGETAMQMSAVNKSEKEKLSMIEKDKKKADMNKETMEIMGRSKRRSRGMLGNKDVTSGISGNSIVKKASQKPGDSLMIVFNALYYKGSWATPFGPQKRGLSEEFYTAAGEKLSVSMMHAEGTFNIASVPELDSVAIELPYQGDRYALLVVLPNKRDGLHALVTDHLPKHPLHDVFRRLGPKKAQVCLPSFEVETTTKPMKAFETMGVNEVFDKEKADLSGISKDSGLFVDDLAQFVTIKVEPDYSSTNYLTGSNVDRPETRTGTDEEKFVADHPFLYFVVDKRHHDMIVVAGKVTDPTYKTSPFKKVKF